MESAYPILAFRFAREITSIRTLALTDLTICTFKLKHFKNTCTNLQSSVSEKGKFCVLILERIGKIIYFTISLLTEF